MRKGQDFGLGYFKLGLSVRNLREADERSVDWRDPLDMSIAFKVGSLGQGRD